MLARVLAVWLLGVLPAGAYAQNPWKMPADSRLDAIGGVLSYLRADKPHRDLPRDNINLWQPSIGFGAQVEVGRNWALRMDIDRYQPKFPGSMGRESLDTFVVGIQYRGS